MDDLANAIREANRLESMYRSMGYSEYEARVRARIITEWHAIKLACSNYNIMPNSQDYKSYVVGSLARLQENKWLKEELIYSIRKLLEEFSEAICKSFKSKEV